MGKRAISLQLPEQRVALGEDDGDLGLGGALTERQLCHDLRGLLSTIRLLAETARADADTSPRAASSLEALIAEVNVANELVRRVMHRERHLELIDLADMAHQRASVLCRSTGVHVIADASPASLMSDGVALRRIVDNLLENAVRAAGSGGHVAVRTFQRARLDEAGGQEVLLVVEDSGSGFDETMPWRQGSLGLHVVMSLVAELGGEVEVGSSSHGGARVDVSLPAG